MIDDYEEDRMDSPMFFIDRETGDLMITWYQSNIPPLASHWTRISSVAYERISGIYERGYKDE